MDETITPTPDEGLNLSDVLYAVFRHKGKILLISALGVVASLLLPIVRPAPFQSEARLYIRYVLETRSPSQAGENDSRIRSPDARGDSIIRTELEILTSMDLAQQVADAVGPEKILRKAASTNSPATDRFAAAAVIRKNLEADVPKDSSVIRVAFHHANPQIVQPVLTNLIDFYFKKHGQIHAVGAFDDFLTQETDQRRSRLAQTEEELRKAKAKAEIISLEDTKHAYSEQIAKLQQAIFDTQAQLAERRAAADELAPPPHASPLNSTNGPAGTNSSAVVSSDKAAEYRRICGLLETLNRREQELLLTYTPSNSLVREVRTRIEANEEIKQKLELDDPGLVSLHVTSTNAVGGEIADPRATLRTERAQVTGLESRLKTLNEQLNEVRQKATALGQVEASITDLQRKLQLEETNYARFSQGLEQAHLDERLGAGKVSNISTIQEPTPPMPAQSKLAKMVLMARFGGVLAAFALVFLIEFFLDRSVRRPSDVERKLDLPLFVSIPFLDGRGDRHAARGKLRRMLPRSSSPGVAADQLPATDHPSLATDQPSALTTHQPSIPDLVRGGLAHGLQPWAEALRDRLITYFEVNNMTHKPKLVAVTSCGEGSGVSTIAAGLAASLSETGDGNVLLVDMNLPNGAAHQFYKGDLACGLDDALESEKRSTALVHENLYFVTESANNDKLPRILPKRFTHLMPKLKASDYDYIIFDMPPVSRVSATPRLARFMDMVLMVVESEKTDREVVKRASSLLTESKANLGIVLNKGRQYVPKRLQQEL